jgi:MFS family permease
VTCVAQFMLILDLAVINVALPDLGTDLDLSRTAFTWAVSAYVLFFGGLMLLGGRRRDHLCPRPRRSARGRGGIGCRTDLQPARCRHLCRVGRHRAAAGLTSTPSIDGFTDAFTVFTIVAAVVAVLSLRLVPSGAPQMTSAPHAH